MCTPLPLLRVGYPTFALGKRTVADEERFHSFNGLGKFEAMQWVSEAWNRARVGEC